ncbi:hypothetical protein FA13DRAFT_1788644 [Coprinellus micaceus]|uniref:Uncharacterized protein n=1 Tax=Coprinellus micaceus TaxID=71717 RepID=A0A4Y7TLI0_COPMI|nr:hypothetical protein FA13DRAFT_1788644 [Coprinellus micaceus]
MLSVYPLPSPPLPSVFQPKIISPAVPTLRDAVEPFTKAILRSRPSGTKLLCTIPTWGSADDAYCDFNDIQEKKSKLLVLIHELVKSLRSAGVRYSCALPRAYRFMTNDDDHRSVATYSLTPSSSSHSVVCALPPNTYLNQVVISEVEKARSTSSANFSVVEGPAGPCLVVN